MTLNGHKLTKAQRRVADAVALGRDDGLHPGPVKALLRRKIIESYTVNVGAYHVRRYRMPIRVHIEWARQSDGERTP